MGQDTNISWTDYTFNPWIGCTKVSAACDFCYAEDHALKREPLVTWGKPGQRPKHRRTVDSNWRNPLAWNKSAMMSIASQARRERPRVFCASLADVFDNDVPNEWRADLWDIIGATRHLTWQLLTKRPQNISKMLPKSWGQGWSHVWLGTTTETQEEFDRRWPILWEIPAFRRFISYEPALNRLSLARWHRYAMPDWVICGGESGPNRRPFDLGWAESLREQCKQFDIPFFFKQDSSHKPGCKGRASDELWNTKQFPESHH